MICFTSVIKNILITKNIVHVQLTINNVPKHKNIYIFSIINYYKNTKLRNFVGEITDYHPIKLSGFKLQLC